jgi:AraC-like DNA-binding protein
VLYLDIAALQPDNSPVPPSKDTPPRSKNLAQQLLDSPELLEQYIERTVNAAHLAAQFGYQESYVLATLSRLGVKRPKTGVSTYRIQQNRALLAATRKEFRAFLAKKVGKGEISLKNAAEMASCSERTVRRYLKKA